MDFILTALPRSGTTWASVWLMDGALCLHDPLGHMTPTDLRNFNPGQRWGISCTGFWLRPSVMESFNCPIAILDKNLSAVNDSLMALGMAPLGMEVVSRFDAAPGRRFETYGMFNDPDTAQELWGYLRPDKPFDFYRWKLLREMHIEPDFTRIKLDQRHVMRLQQEFLEMNDAVRMG